MNSQSLCRNCKREIPSHANFCPYCGIENPISKSALIDAFEEFESKVEETYKRLLSKLDPHMPKISAKIQKILDKVEDKILTSKTPNFVNKAKVLDTLNKIRDNLEKNYSKRAEKEARDYTTYVEQAISGDKCIICLSPFDVKNNNKVDVYACPNCYYAGHRDHFIDWLAEKKICPLCRAEISHKDLIKGKLIEKDNMLILKS